MKFNVSSGLQCSVLDRILKDSGSGNFDRLCNWYSGCKEDFVGGAWSRGVGHSLFVHSTFDVSVACTPKVWCWLSNGDVCLFVMSGDVVYPRTTSILGGIYKYFHWSFYDVKDVGGVFNCFCEGSVYRDYKKGVLFYFDDVDDLSHYHNIYDTDYSFVHTRDRVTILLE